MTRYVCSLCGYASDSAGSVAKHIKKTHHKGASGSSEDRYGNTTPSYEYRAKIMQYDPEEAGSEPDTTTAQDGPGSLVSAIKRLLGRR